MVADSKWESKREITLQKHKLSKKIKKIDF